MNGTGPMGQGAMSGRGRGFCGSGVGQRMNGGVCCGRRFYSATNELLALQEEEKFPQNELVAIQEEIKTLESQK